MTIVRCVVVWFLITSIGHGQVPQKHDSVELSSKAEASVARLYQQLVSHPVGGIPTPEEMKVLSPYLSSSLAHRISETRACTDDWFRQHPKNDVKAPLDWLEFGLFSGANDRSGPGAFRIEKMELQDDGSFRAYVRLTEGPPEKPWNWRVAVVVTTENGLFKINDVIYLRDKSTDTESRLSELLRRGCDGSHWVGFKNAKKKAQASGLTQIYAGDESKWGDYSSRPTSSPHEDHWHISIPNGNPTPRKKTP